MKKDLLIYSLIALAVILCIPSIIYLANNKTVDGFDAYYNTYTLSKSDNYQIRTINGIFVIGLITLFGILYLILLKNQNIIFKNTKQMIILVVIISIIFTLIMPFLSTDIYYYIGDSWLNAKYGENPYYTTVQDLQNKGINDEILDNTGVWKNTVSVYGPVWNVISTFLVSLSFGNLTIALFIYKIAAFCIHIFNCYLIYQITKNKKYILLYGLNPLVLVEFLSDVHNDIYFILFLLLAMYFFIRKRNICLTILCFALTIGIKYSTILIVPFLLIYFFKKQKITKKIIYCFISGISMIAIVIIFYLPYYRDITIFTTMISQTHKYSQSILALALIKMPKIFNIVKEINLPLLAVSYLYLIYICLKLESIRLRKCLRIYNLIMLWFIFITLTSFQKWYILWLLPTLPWQSKNMRKFLLYLTVTALIPSISYYSIGNDAFMVGIGYSSTILILSGIILLSENLIKKYKFDKQIEKLGVRP